MFEDTNKSISLPVEDCGQLQLDLQGGQMTEKSSQPAARASLSALQESNEKTHGRQSQNNNGSASEVESGVGDVGNPIDSRLEGHNGYGDSGQGRSKENGSMPETDHSNSYWGDNWIECYDGKARRTQPGLCFLVDGVQLVVADSDDGGAAKIQSYPKGRIEAWKIAGNAIVPSLAATVIKSVFN